MIFWRYIGFYEVSITKIREIRIYVSTHLFLQILELFGPIKIFYDRKAIPNYIGKKKGVL